MKDICAVVQIDLLKHSLNRALAFFINRKRLIHLIGDIGSDVETMVIEYQCYIGNSSANGLCKSPNVLEQIRIQPGQVAAVLKRGSYAR